MVETRDTAFAGINFDPALIDAVQAEVLHEGILPTDKTVASALYHAYRGGPSRDLIDEAAARVWAERAAILARRDA